MTIGIRRLVLLALMVLMVVGIADRAHGFFPRGGYNLNQQLRYATWPFREFDTNDNGVIEQGEGLEFRIEGGPRGFTLDEIEQVKAGFKVWHDVPTSYVALRFAGVIEDPIIPGIGLPDYLPTVFMQVNRIAENDGYSQMDDLEFQIPELGGGLIGIALALYTIDMTPVPVGGNVVMVPAGSILDCDIILDAAYYRTGLLTDSTFGVLDLQAAVTKVVGSLLGLGDTPLNNLDPFNDLAGLPVEPAVMQLTGSDGLARMVGATPTMFPAYFLTRMPNGDYIPGWSDLAPDDISGISWLYPREDGLENFFNVEHEARTQVRNATGIPPAPISGAHIVAWADVTDSPSGRRVPMFSTMSGLYEMYTDTQLSGRFNMQGLWKQLEVPGKEGTLFEPSYVMTMSPLNGLGYDRQAPPGMTSSMFDSIQSAFPVSFSTIVRPATEFSTNYPSEVFNEDGNIYGVDNYAAGTPLAWSFEKNALISMNSNKTLPRILPRNMPMFGDPDTVCPMNIIENIDGIALPAGIGSLNNKLRNFRDNTLLNSAVGTAVVEMYYRVAPYVGYQMFRHDALMRMVRGGVVTAMWMWERLMSILILGILSGIMAMVIIKRHRLSPAGIAVVVMALLLCVAAASHATQLPMSTEEMVAQSTHIISGKVLSAEGALGVNNRIYTNVAFEISDVAKGDLNRGSTITFSVIGGQYGTLALAATGIPGFVAGEHAVLHLVDVPNYGLVPQGGLHSKVPIYVDPDTEEEEVISSEGEGEATEGEVTEGEVTEGEVTEGEVTEGEATEGEVTEGEVTEGEVTEGEVTEGEVTEGEATEGEATEGEQKKSVPVWSAKAASEAKAGRMPLRTYMRHLRSIANAQR